MRFVIVLSCSREAVKIFSNEGKESRSCFEIVGPIPGNPSKINCFCCLSD